MFVVNWLLSSCRDPKSDPKPPKEPIVSENYEEHVQKRIVQLERSPELARVDTHIREKTARYIEEQIAHASIAYIKRSKIGSPFTLFCPNKSDIYLRLTRPPAKNCTTKQYHVIKIPRDRDLVPTSVIQKVARKEDHAERLLFTAKLEGKSGIRNEVSEVYKSRKVAFFYEPEVTTLYTSTNDKTTLKSHALSLLKALKSVHDQGLIHGGLKLDALQFDPRTQEVFLTGFSHIFEQKKGPPSGFCYNAPKEFLPPELLRGGCQDYRAAEVYTLAKIIQFAYSRQTNAPHDPFLDHLLAMQNFSPEQRPSLEECIKRIETTFDAHLDATRKKIRVALANKFTDKEALQIAAELDCVKKNLSENTLQAFLAIPGFYGFNAHLLALILGSEPLVISVLLTKVSPQGGWLEALLPKNMTEDARYAFILTLYKARIRARQIETCFEVLSKAKSDYTSGELLRLALFICLYLDQSHVAAQTYGLPCDIHFDGVSAYFRTSPKRKYGGFKRVFTSASYNLVEQHLLSPLALSVNRTFRKKTLSLGFVQDTAASLLQEAKLQNELYEAEPRAVGIQELSQTMPFSKFYLHDGFPIQLPKTMIIAPYKVTLADLAKEKLTTEMVATLLLQTLIGLNKLHSRGLVHRDIKLENILCDKEPLDARLHDLGVVVEATQDNPFIGGYYKTVLATPPELMGMDRYPLPCDTKACDIWAIAHAFYPLLFGKPVPWNGIIASYRQKEWCPISEFDKMRILECIQSDPNLKKPATSTAQRFVQQALQITPSDRPSCPDALKFFAK